MPALTTRRRFVLGMTIRCPRKAASSKKLGGDPDVVADILPLWNLERVLSMSSKFHHCSLFSWTFISACQNLMKRTISQSKPKLNDSLAVGMIVNHKHSRYLEVLRHENTRGSEIFAHPLRDFFPSANYPFSLDAG